MYTMYKVSAANLIFVFSVDIESWGKTRDWKKSDESKELKKSKERIKYYLFNLSWNSMPIVPVKLKMSGWRIKQSKKPLSVKIVSFSLKLF